MDSAFEKFKKNCSLIKFEYHGIKLNQILSYKLWKMGENSKYNGNGLKGCFRTLKIASLQQDAETGVLATCVTSRKDQLVMNDYALRKINEKIIPNHLCDRQYRERCFYPFVMLKCLIYVFAILRVFTLKQKLKIFYDLVYYCNCIRSIEKLDLANIRRYITFQSCTELDCLFTLFLKKRGIITYSLSEGIHIFWKKDVPVDILHFINFVSDYKYCLSECHKNEYIKYGISPEKLLVGGYLKDVQKRPLKVENRFNKCLVLLCRNSYETANLKLLDILKKYNRKVSFSIKLHPDNNFEYYKKNADNNGFNIIEKNKGLLDCLKQDDYDFCIAVNTNCYYDSLIVGIPCLRFSDGSFDELPGIAEDIFNDEHSFGHSLEYIKGTELYQKKIDMMLEYVIGFGIDNYKTFFI